MVLHVHTIKRLLFVIRSLSHYLQSILPFLQLSSLQKDEEPSDALKEFLLPYRDEAAVLQVPLSVDKRHLAVQQIMLHNVIEKRRRELTDLAAGMNELSLVNYLKAHEEMTTAVFPRECESVIDKDELKARISIEDENHPQGQVIMGFLHQFIDEVSRVTEGKLLPLMFSSPFSIQIFVSVFNPLIPDRIIPQALYGG